jgi:thioesterase domain-containing protein
MTAAELEELLHLRIPVARAMCLSVVTADNTQVVLQAPLEQNVNPHGTAFGGSITNLALLAGWSMAYMRLHEKGYGDHLVISRVHVDFLAPMGTTIEARCQAPKDSVIERFIHHLERRGKARIELRADVSADGVMGAHFQGEFVAMAGNIIEREILRGK